MSLIDPRDTPYTGPYEVLGQAGMEVFTVGIKSVAKAAGYSHVIIDGTLIEPDRVAAPGPTPVDLFAHHIGAISPPQQHPDRQQHLRRRAARALRPPRPHRLTCQPTAHHTRGQAHPNQPTRPGGTGKPKHQQSGAAPRVHSCGRRAASYSERPHGADEHEKRNS